MGNKNPELKSTRGGRRENQTGRPRLPDSEKRVKVAITMTREHYEATREGRSAKVEQALCKLLGENDFKKNNNMACKHCGYDGPYSGEHEKSCSKRPEYQDKINAWYNDWSRKSDYEKMPPAMREAYDDYIKKGGEPGKFTPYGRS